MRKVFALAEKGRGNMDTFTDTGALDSRLGARAREFLGRGAFVLMRAHTSRACEAEPSDALRQQTDPRKPAGRRFANFFFERFLRDSASGANAGAIGG